MSTCIAQSFMPCVAARMMRLSTYRYKLLF